MSAKFLIRRMRCFIVVAAVFVLFLTPVRVFSGEQANSEKLKLTEVNSGYMVNNLELDNFFRRLLGARSEVPAAKNSRSKRHNQTRPQRYTPPASNSQAPEQKGSGTNTRSSDMTAVRNTPKPPLARSRRDQYQSLGFWEMGLVFSTSHALTDIGASKGLNFNDFTSYHTNNFGYGGGIYGRYLMNDWFGMNMGMNFATLTAERSIPFETIPVNAFSFKNDIFEFYAKSEFRLPTLAASPFDLYAFLGIGVLFSDATIYDQNSRLITMQDDYSQVQPFIPFGFGFSVKLTNTIKLGYEFGWRNTIFHYLDGVKKDDTYDHYFLNSLKLGFTF